MDIAADLCITAKSTAFYSIHRVIKSLVKIKVKHIFFPAEDCFPQIARKFEQVANFPNVIGAVDGTQIPILVPNNDIAETFRCRKGFMSLNVQMICGPGPGCEVYDIDAKWPGSAHDASVWSQSDIRSKIEAFQGDFHILGDSEGRIQSNHANHYLQECTGSTSTPSVPTKGRKLNKT